jgi:hypothetical protein
VSLLQDRWSHFAIVRTIDRNECVISHRVAVRQSASPLSNLSVCSEITIRAGVEGENTHIVTATHKRIGECEVVLRVKGAAFPKSWLVVDIRQTPDSLLETYGFSLGEGVESSAPAVRRLHPLPSDTDVLRYIASYPDLIQAFGADVSLGRQHYFQYGRSEGRGISFDPASYLARHTDLQYSVQTIRDACEHYIRHGFPEGRAVA